MVVTKYLWPAAYPISSICCASNRRYRGTCSLQGTLRESQTSQCAQPKLILCRVNKQRRKTNLVNVTVLATFSQIITIYLYGKLWDAIKLCIKLKSIKFYYFPHPGLFDRTVITFQPRSIISKRNFFTT